MPSNKDSKMIDLYYWPTPNGHKIPIMLEETGLSYRVRPVKMLRGEQFRPAFLRINPNNKIPAIVDRDGLILQRASLPAEIDRQYPNLQQRMATRRVARAVFLGSAPTRG